MLEIWPNNVVSSLSQECPNIDHVLNLYSELEGANCRAHWSCPCLKSLRPTERQISYDISYTWNL